MKEFDIRKRADDKRDYRETEIAAPPVSEEQAETEDRAPAVNASGGNAEGDGAERVPESGDTYQPESVDDGAEEKDGAADELSHRRSIEEYGAGDRIYSGRFENGVFSSKELSAELPQTSDGVSIREKENGKPEDGKKSSEEGKDAGKKKKGKKAIVAVTAAAVFLIASAAVLWFTVFNTPEYRLVSCLSTMFDGRGDYSILNGVESAVSLHLPNDGGGTAATDITASVSTDGEKLDSFFASSMNRWALHAESKADGGAGSVNVTVNFGTGEKELVSVYKNDRTMAVNMFGADKYMSFGSVMNVFRNEDGRSKFIRELLSSFKAANAEEDIFSSERAVYNGEYAENVSCRKVTASFTGAQLKYGVEEMCGRILGDEDLFNYFNNCTYRSTEMSREKLNELKNTFLMHLDDTVEASFYTRYGKILAFELRYESVQDGKKLEVRYEISETDAGFERMLYVDSGDRTCVLTSETDAGKQDRHGNVYH